MAVVVACVLLAVVGLLSGLAACSTVSDRACSKPGLMGFPFCNVSLPVGARIADLISRIEAAEKPKLLTARGWPQGNVYNLSRLGVPAFDWGLNCLHGVQSTCGTNCATSFPMPVAMAASFNMSNVLLMGQARPRARGRGRGSS